MKRIRKLPVIVFVLCLLVPVLVLAAPPDNGGVPDDYLGSLYGDLYIILRDEDGVPILDNFGCVQPTRVKEVDGVLTLVVKQLYTNIAEDLECELLEDSDTHADVDFVQEVDFGRLNLGRAPEPVLNHAFDEAVNAMNNAIDINIDPAGRLVLTLVDQETAEEYEKTIDSPLENLALYVKMMRDGHWITEDTTVDGKGRGGSGGPPEGKGPPEGDGPSVEERPTLEQSAIEELGHIGYGGLGLTTNTLNNHELLLAASLMAAAADKTGSFTVDKVVYANSIYGINDLGSDGDGQDYFDFSAFTYPIKPFGFRKSVECVTDGEAWVLKPDNDHGLEEGKVVYWMAICLPLLSEVSFADVHYMVGFDNEATWHAGEAKANVAGFTQAANDALKTIQYIHNYSVPEILE